MSKTWTIQVPASTSNIGPGFDVLGLTLGLFLTVKVTLEPAQKGISITYEGVDAATVPLDVDNNLIASTASMIAKSHGKMLPPSLGIAIHNLIPLGRGLGSSGAAVVAGVMVANLACDLQLSQERMIDFCLMIEGHPDNITASIVGGFVASYLRELPTTPFTAPDGTRLDIPGHGIGRYVRLPVSPQVKAVVIIPDFELSTKLARQVLPSTYARADVVFNLQRLAVLTTALSHSPPDPNIIYEAMQDRVHQKYRQHLVPGLPQILALHPSNVPGLLGICVSGAGPTVLALATDNFETIGKTVQGIWSRSQGPDGKPITSRWTLLDLVTTGVSVTSP